MYGVHDECLVGSYNCSFVSFQLFIILYALDFYRWGFLRYIFCSSLMVLLPIIFHWEWNFFPSNNFLFLMFIHYRFIIIRSVSLCKNMICFRLNYSVIITHTVCTFSITHPAYIFICIRIIWLLRSFSLSSSVLLCH